MEKLIVTPAEAAKLLCTSKEHIYELLESGEIEAYKQGTYWKIPIESLRKYVTEKARIETEGRR